VDLRMRVVASWDLGVGSWELSWELGAGSEGGRVGV
jgi:hypothetical protein